MTACIFCDIIARKSPARIVYQDELATAFWDIRPIAPTHILVVPNRHIVSINEITAEDETMIGHLFCVARQVAQNEGVHQSGYRLVINTGSHAGQAVFHLHLHLIGGQRLRLPMG